MIEKFLAAWCRNMHSGAMWPMHGRYICRQCLRQHPVAWEDARATALPAPRPSRAVSAAPASMDVCA
jgi:hypothetical protein